MCAARKPSSSSEPRSAQWTSSNTSTAGVRVRRREPADDGVGLLERVAPATSAGSSRRLKSHRLARSEVRSICRHGHSSGAPSIASHCPTCVATLAAAASLASCSSRSRLPISGSPPTSTVPPWPRCASARAARRSTRSGSRRRRGPGWATGRSWRRKNYRLDTRPHNAERDQRDASLRNRMWTWCWSPTPNHGRAGSSRPARRGRPAEPAVLRGVLAARRMSGRIVQARPNGQRLEKITYCWLGELFRGRARRRVLRYIKNWVEKKVRAICCGLGNERASAGSGGVASGFTKT